MLRLSACWLMLCTTGIASAQKLVKVGEFASAEDNVQFLPGGFVVLHNDIVDSKTKTYQYRSGKFVKVKGKLPPAISQWNSFNWESVDQLGQRDVAVLLNKSIAAFLPPYSTVKAETRIPGAVNKAVAVENPLVLVCYAIPGDDVPEAFKDSGGPKTLRLLLVTRPPGQEFTTTVYTKVADVLVAEEVAFGALLVERQPAGTFVVVYFADGGSTQTDEIAVYLLKPRIARSKPLVR